MTVNVVPWRSLKTRVTLFTLAIFVIGIWSLTFYTSRMLREDMQRLMGEQQASTVSFVADDVNNELNERLRALGEIAGEVHQTMLGNAAALQRLLEERPVLQRLFNGGVIAVRADGTAVAEVPLSAGRVGVNYMDSGNVAAALKEGKATVGRPVTGRKLLAPIVSMLVPLRDTEGRVIGALMGVTNLGAPNFLDKISGNRYGKAGGYLLIAPQHRLVVTATDKSRSMEVLPAHGISPWIDRVSQGFEGTNIFVNPLGVEVLTSVKRVPVAGWLMVIASPTVEVFAPIRALQQRVWLTSIFLTLLAGGLTWWMLRRQMAPMLVAARTLATLSETNQSPQPLPVTSQDEIGDLIGGFNHLLERLGQREDALRKSEERFRTIFEEAPLGVALIDSLTGSICEVNPKFAEIAGRLRAEVTNGDWKSITGSDEVEADLSHMAVLNAGKIPGVSSAKQYVRPDGSAVWIDMTIAPIAAEDIRHPRHVAMIEDITGRKHAEEALHESEERFRVMFEGAPDAIILADPVTRTIVDVNAAACHLLGRTREEIVGMRQDQLHPSQVEESSRESFDRHVKDAHVLGITHPIETIVLRPDGTAVPVEILAQAIRIHDRDILMGTFRDITDRQRAEEALRDLLREKEALLKEVHHRVKNNLQVISSLLRLEAGRTGHAATASTLEEMQGRIRSMALIHESLYRSGTFAAVDLGAYLTQLTTQAFHALVARPDAVQLRLDLAPVRVEMDQAMPCGLLVNELISNCFKHGFPDGRTGEVRVELHPVNGGPQVRLRVSDTGAGLPDDFEIRRGDSLGLQLVSDLVRQLRGTLEIGPWPAAVFSVTFPAGWPRPSANES